MGDMNVILSLNGYSIYDCNNYYLCVPNEDSNFYHVFMGFSPRDLAKSSKEKLIIEIRRIADSIHAVYKNAVYVLPVIDPLLLKEVTTENDDKEYNKLLKNIIQPITLSVYGKLVSQNKRVSQIIKMVKQNYMDKKLIGWLSMKLGDDFIKEIIFVNKYELLNSSVSYQIDDAFIDDNEIPVNYQIDDTFIDDNQIPVNYQIDDVFVSDSNKGTVNYQIDDMLVSNSSKVSVDYQIDDVFATDSNEILVNYQIDDMLVSNSTKFSVDYQIDDVFATDSSQKTIEHQIDDVFMYNANQISIDHKIDDVWLKNEENKISKILKPAFSPGFSALRFLLLVLGIFLVLGAMLGYLIIK